ncbi:putative RNA-directed DNA polymerase [Helianthus annuus]|nr:putative RNA-directed DNA polymerase [Helianthus annuus]
MADLMNLFGETLISKLEPGNPLYLHASDSTNLTVISIKLKGTENYTVWANAMILALRVKNKIGFIDGTFEKPVDNPVLETQWERCNSVVLTWILNSVSEELYLGHVYSKSASEVWKELRDTYDKIDGSVVFDLYQKINSFKQNNLTVAEYYHKLNIMWKQLDQILQIPICTCNASTQFNSFNHLIKLMQFLMGLDNTYQTVRTNLLIREPLPSLQDAFSIVSREESHRSSNLSSSNDRSVGLFAKSTSVVDNKKKFVKNSNQSLKCTNCNKTGHTVDKCFELIGYPSWMKPPRGNQGKKNGSNNNVCVDNSSVPITSLTSDQLTKLLSLIKDGAPETSQSCNVSGFVNQENPGDWTPTSVLAGKTPYELVYKFKPFLDHLKVFGCLCFCTVLNEHDKLNSRVEKCVFIGYSLDKKGYKLFSLDSRTIIFSRDVKFYESVFPFKEQSVFENYDSNPSKDINTLNFFDLYDNAEHKHFQPVNDPDDERRVRGEADVRTQEDQQSENLDPPIVTADEQQTSEVQESSDGADPVTITDEAQVPSEGDTDCSSSPVMPRRSSRVSNFPKKLNDFVIDSKVKYGIERVVNFSKLTCDNKCFASSLSKAIEPKYFKDAVKDPNWVSAMNDEIQALHRNHTWDVVDRPKNRNVVGCKWIFKIKYKSSGEIERYKARLVAKGFSQKEGIDYEETFSPVIKLVTVRCIVALAVQNNWNLYQLDVNNAFLYGDLNEDVYMSLPEGYEGNDRSKVCKLNKSLYGLKQAPRMWNEKLVGVLLSSGFVQSKCDTSLFVKNKDKVFIVLLVYVDDIVVTGNSLSEIEKVKQRLKSQFLIKDLGLLQYFLGIEVLTCDKGLCLSQRKYCTDLLAEYGMLGCKPVSIPIDQSHVVNTLLENNSGPLQNITGYQQLVGKLIYLSHTRPDISYAVHVLSQFMHSPTEGHLKLAFHLLRYLKSAPGKGLLFSKSQSFNLTVFADSDWAKCLVTRKSVTGFCVFLGNSLVSWKSKKQSTVSRSSAEAEYRSMCAAACEAVWLKNLLSELEVNVEVPIKLFCDNNAAISIAANPVFHDRTKHFELDLFFLRDLISKGTVRCVGIKSEMQVADVFTKGVLVKDHQYLCGKLQLFDMFS